VGGGVKTGSTRHVGHWMAYCSCPGWLWWWWWWRIWWNEEWQGKPKYSEKTYLSATLSTNPTWPDPGLNPGRRGGKPATNRLSYGAVVGVCTSSGLRRYPQTNMLYTEPSARMLIYLLIGTKDFYSQADSDVTERRLRRVSTLASQSGGPGLKSWPWVRLFMVTVDPADIC
jgi:hypothetical protein